MSRVRIAPIVEGHGEVQAAPMLIRRIAAEVDPELTAVVEPPIRMPANRLRKPGELERTVELAARKLGGAGGILIRYYLAKWLLQIDAADLDQAMTHQINCGLRLLQGDVADQRFVRTVFGLHVDEEHLRQNRTETLHAQ